MGGSDWLHWRNWSCLCTWACCKGNGYRPGSYCHDVLGWVDLSATMSWGLMAIRVMVDCGLIADVDDFIRFSGWTKHGEAARSWSWASAQIWLQSADHTGVVPLWFPSYHNNCNQNPGRLTSQTSLCSPWLSRDSKKKGLRLGNYFLWQIF